MKIRPTSPLFEPEECRAVVTCKHPRACFGLAVLVIEGPDGGAIGPSEAEFAAYEVLDATPEERHSLALAGYRLKGLAPSDLEAAAAT